MLPQDKKQMNEPTPLGQLFAVHHERLLRFATALLHSEEEAEDAVSEVFEKLVSDGLPETEVALLFVAVRHRCIDRLRQLKVAERVRRRLPLDEPSLTAWEQEEEYERRRATLSKAIETGLTTPMRRTLQLRYYEEKSYREIAETMNISQVAVYKHLRNALERLRKIVTSE